MRILSLSHVARDLKAGAASATLLMNQAIRDSGHEVIEVFSDDLLSRPTGRRARELLPFLAAVRSLRSSGDVDVIEISGHAGWLAFPMLRAGRFCRRRRDPLLVARSYGLEHFDHAVRLEEQRLGRAPGSPLYRLGGGFLTLREVEISIAASDLFAASRPGAATWAVRRHLKKPDECSAAGFGVVSEAFSVDRSDVQPGRVGWVGSTVERKGWRDFVDGLTLAWGRDPGISAAILGTGRSAADVLGGFPGGMRDRVQVYPRVSQEALFGALASCSCFVSTSLSEGYHLAALQAMAIGVPVIATREGYLADLESDDNAPLHYQIPKRMPRALAQTICEVAPSTGTSPQAAEIAIRAKSYAASRSWERVAARTLEAYDAALCRRPGAKARLRTLGNL